MRRNHPGTALAAVGSCLFALFAFSPAHAGGPLASGEVAVGTIGGPSYVEAWTFSGAAGQRIVIGAVTSSGLLNTTIDLKPPGGGASVIVTSADRVEFQLLATGTYTLTIGDLGSDTPGNYSVSYLNITAGPHATAGDPDGGALASAVIRTGLGDTIVDFDAYTFSGAAGDRVLFAAVSTSGSYNTSITIYPPGGGLPETSTSSDRLDHTLLASGVYTVVMEDGGLDHTGGYSLHFTNLTQGPLFTAGDPDGGFTGSAELRTGQIDAVADFDTYRFSGNFGERFVLAAVTTGGTLNTNLAIYPPSGTPLIYTSADRVELQLPATGIFTVVVEDLGLDTPGAYTLALMNVTAGPFVFGTDLDGGGMASASSRTGQAHGTADFDAYTFGGAAGDRVLVSGLATGGAMNTSLSLYPPGGGPAEVVTSSDRLDHQLLQSGTYTLLVEDVGLDDTGSYILTLLNLTAGPLTATADPDGGNIVSGEIRTGQMQTLGDFDAWRLTGNAGERMIVSALATGGGLNTNIAIYPPSGPAVVYTSADRIEYQLIVSGTHTIVVEDLGLDATGPYTLAYLNVTAGPLTTGPDPDGGPIVSAGSAAGQVNSACDFDAFTFSGTAGNRVLLAGLATAGTMNTSLALYPPGGGPAEAATSGDRLDHQLLSSGVYTVVMEDVGNDNTGAYLLTLLNLGAGPLTSGGDPDGGALASGETRAAQINAPGDFDAYTFSGGFGQRVIVAALGTAGTFNTNIVLYPPAGPAVVYTSADRVEYQLTSSGSHTIVIEDLGLDETGSYTIGLINVTGGPHTSAGDPDGGALVSANVVTGQGQGVVDFDVFTFAGLAGDRVILGGLATGGSYNTSMTLYPPGGGAAESATSGDRLDHQLLRTGTYTVVMEDVGLDHAGTYSLTLLNLTSGPHSSGSDADGGILARGQTRIGQITPVPDLDAFEFYGTAGDTARITCVTTAGTLNTNVALYPPGGGPAVVYTSADNITYVLSRTGYYGAVVEDLGLDNTGSYSINLAGAGGVVDVADDAVPDRLELAPAAPNPFSGSTTFAFALPVAGPVELAIHDVRGARLRTLAHGSHAAGMHRLTWDGRNEGGRSLPSGVYWVRLTTAAGELRRKVLLVR